MKNVLGHTFLFVMLMFVFIFCIIVFCIPLNASAADIAENAGSDFLQSLCSIIPESWDSAVTLLISVCAMISSIWSCPKENSPAWVKLAYKIVNAIAFNAGKAKNADDAAAKAAKLAKQEEKSQC